MKDGLKDKHRKAIIDILSANEGVERVVLFGSRAMGTFTPTSDVDIVLYGDELTPTDRLKLAAAIDELPIPQRVDLLLHKSIQKKELLHHIETHGVEWWRRSEGVGGEWRQKRTLDDLTTVIVSSVDKKTKPGEHPIRLCNYKDVYTNQYIRPDIDFMNASATDREIEKCSLIKDDVVITKDSEKNDDIGVPAYISDNIDNLVCGYHLVILRPKSNKIDGAYLFYALNTRESANQFHARANGITRFGLRKADVGTVEIPTPPLADQSAIAHILGSLDDKIELNRRMNQTLEAMARAIFKSWFVDFDPVRAKAEGRPTGLPDDIAALFPDSFEDSELGEIPKGWGVVPLSEIVDVNPARTLKKGQIAPYLEMKNMPENSARALHWYDREYGSGVKFINGDVLMARITPCLENGKGAFIDFLKDDQIGWGSTEYIVFRSKKPLPLQYSYFLSRTNDFRSHAIVNMTGSSGRQRVPAAIFDSYLVVNPSREVAECFGMSVDLMMQKIKKNDEEAHTLASLRDTLLPKLISGELRVPDAAKFLQEVSAGTADGETGL